MFESIKDGLDKKELPHSGTGRDVLYAVKARVPKRSRRALASPPNVFRSAKPTL